MKVNYISATQKFIRESRTTQANFISGRLQPSIPPKAKEVQLYADDTLPLISTVCEDGGGQ